MVLQVPQDVMQKANSILRDYFIVLQEDSSQIQEDEWYTVTNEWDLNVFENDKGQVEAYLYPVADSNTETRQGGERIF